MTTGKQRNGKALSEICQEEERGPPLGVGVDGGKKGERSPKEGTNGRGLQIYSDQKIHTRKKSKEK